MEKSIMTLLTEAVAEGKRWKVDFKNRSLKINGEYLVENGVCNRITGIERYPSDQFLWHVEKAYELYKHSIPSERSESRSKNYFLALSEKELKDEDMMYGVDREMARAELEGFVLCSLLEGVTWDESWGKWFWQSSKDKDLVLLREWFEEPAKVEGV